MKITLIAFTKKGANICLKLTDCLREKGHQTTGFSKYDCNGLNLVEDSLYDFTKKAFKKGGAIVYIGAVGIAVRAIAPFIRSKAQDPAIVVVDEAGEYAIPVLSGHLGGANDLAGDIAKLIGGKAVITTATDINNVFAVDVWAQKSHLHIDNVENIKYISSAVLNEEKVGFYSDFPVDGGLPRFLTNGEADTGIYIYDSIVGKRYGHPFSKTLFMSPKQFVVGIGCRKGTKKEILAEVFLETLSKLNIMPNLVRDIATIDIKREERAIICLCEKYQYVLNVYNSDELFKATGNFTTSEFVKRITGVDNVCERAAFLASNAGEFVLRKTAKNGITIAVAVKGWRCSF
jgi:cobalt-precorrin 5A hydrolase